MICCNPSPRDTKTPSLCVPAFSCRGPLYQSDLWPSVFRSGLNGFPATLQADALCFTLPARSQNSARVFSGLFVSAVVFALSPSPARFHRGPERGAL